MNRIYRHRIAIRKTLAGYLFLSLPVLLSGQTFRERLNEMHRTYANVSSMHIKMVVEVFEDADTKHAVATESVEIRKQDDNFSYELRDMSMLMNKSYLLVADKASKEIVCSRRSVRDEKKFFGDPVKMNLDSLLSFYGDGQILEESGQTIKYRLAQNQGAIQLVDVVLDKSTNLLREMAYHYRDGNYVTIRFTLFNLAPVFTEATFNESRFVVIEKGRMRPSHHFAGFTVVQVENL